MEEYEFLTQGSDMVCKVKIIGRKIEVLLDSGSEVSLQKSSVFKDLKTNSIWVRDSDLTVTQAKGQKMKLSGMVHLTIKVGGITTCSKLYIAPDLDRTMILSEDWLKKNQAQINFNLNQLKIKGIEIPLGSEPSGEVNIYSVDNIQLPPHTAVSCTARLGPTEQPKETLYQVIPRVDKKKGPRRISRLPKKHLFHSRPEVLRTTFRHYKISKS